MERVFKKIYEEVICHEENVQEMNKVVENEMIHILERYKNRLEGKEEEELLELLDEASSFAEYAGFYMGMKYAVKGMLALLKD